MTERSPGGGHDHGISSGELDLASAGVRGRGVFNKARGNGRGEGGAAGEDMTRTAPMTLQSRTRVGSSRGPRATVMGAMAIRRGARPKPRTLAVTAAAERQRGESRDETLWTFAQRAGALPSSCRGAR